MTEVVAALIWDNDRFMICKRPPEKKRGLLWEFVGGKPETGESLEEALMLTGERTEREAVSVLTSKVSAVLVTKGAEGALWAKGDRVVFLPPTKACTVDTTGAGDIFFGVFLSAMLSGGYTPQSLDGEKAEVFGKKACYFAAKSTEKHGAIPSIPNFS